MEMPGGGHEPSPGEAEPVIGSVDKKGWLTLGAGFVIALIVLFLLPWISWVFSYFVTLVHEFGHAIFGWLFGYPSVPAFDFRYGGGITAHQQRHVIIVVAVYGLFCLGLYAYRRNRLTLICLSIGVLLYSLFAFTALHKILILFMGHGLELVFAGIFLYRALSGSAIINALERPLYAIIGFFIELFDIQFAFRLFASPRHRAEYAGAKGGGHWMDFSRIAEEYLHVEVSTVALLFLICCVLPPLAAFLAHRYRDRLHAFIRSLLAREDARY
jgi:hypothetical protein